MVKLMTLKDVADALNLSPQRLYQQLDAGEVPRPPMRFGNAMVFRPQDVRAILVARAKLQAERDARRLTKQIGTPKNAA